MARIGRIVSSGIGILLAVLTVLVVALLVTPWNWARGPLTKRLSDASDRGVAIDGPLRLHLGATTTLVADQVRISNAPWGSEPDMLRIKQVAVSISLADLLRGRTVLPELKLTEPDILLEKNQGGEANWRLANPKAQVVQTVAVPKNRSEVPIIEHLVVERGRLAYKDPTHGIDLDSRITTAVGGDPAHQQVTLQGNGNFQGAPFRLSIEGGSILQLRDQTKPYPLRIEAMIGNTRGGVDGTLTEPLDLAGIDLQMHLSGDNLADIYPIFGIPIPNTQPYSFQGRLIRQGDTWTFQDFNGTVGASDLSGTVSVVTGTGKPKMNAVLTSKNLDVQDLGGFVGATPGHGQAVSNPDRVLPDRPINLERLRAMDMDVHFQGRRVQAWALPFEDLNAALEVADGRATLAPLAFGLANGKIGGTVVLDGRQDVPAAHLDLSVQRVNLTEFFHDPRLREDISGTFGGRIDIAGRGNSTAAILAKADGRITLFMGDGHFSELLVDLIGLEVGKALGVLATKDTPVTIRCMVADFPVQQGAMNADTLVFDTTTSNITGQGRINLADEALNLQLTAHPKKPSLLAATAPIQVGGTFKKPSFGISPAAEAARTGTAAALGALLTPLGALIPFIDLGLGKDSPCRQLIEQAKASPQQAGSPTGAKPSSGRD